MSSRSTGGFVLTIDSDDENISEEEVSEDSDVERKKNILTRKKVVPRKEVKRVLDAETLDEDFEDETIHNNQNSWDFTSAIAKMRKKENPSQQVVTTLQEKIKNTLDRKKSKAVPSKVDTAGYDESDSPDEVLDGASNEESKENNTNDQTEEPLDSMESKDGAEDPIMLSDQSRSLGSQALLSKLKAKQPSSEPEKSFADLNLSRPLIKAVQALGFSRPSPIQQNAIPFALAGRDICGSAATGSGKTAAFVLPTLERLLFRNRRNAATRVLILTPTRELTQQVLSMIEKLAQFTDIKATAIVGGLSMSSQASELRSRPDIVVATPGRLIDHIRNTQSVDLDDVEILILDEADRLLELGFMDEVTEVVKFCPKSRQTMLFSATMTTSVNRLAELSLNRPVRVQTDPLYDLANRLVQEFVRIRDHREEDREAMLLSLCVRTFKSQTIIFFRKKRTAHRLSIIFGLSGLSVGELHGNLSQRQRLEALQKFRDGEVHFLMCTDLASRGLDISGIEAVINYEMPSELATYVHRVGRTARAGRGGIAVTLTGERERKLTREVLKRSKQNVKARTIPDAVVASFKQKIEALEEDIRDVMDQEKVEREMRKGEMEATRAENIVQHKDEIMSRPAKTWFQSGKEKEELKRASKEEFEKTESGIVSKKGQNEVEEESKSSKKKKAQEKKPHNLTREKRKRLEAKQNEEQELKRLEREAYQKAEETGEAVDEAALRRLLTPLETKVRIQAKAAKRAEKRKAEEKLEGDKVRGKAKKGKREQITDLESSDNVAKRPKYARGNGSGMFDFEFGSRQGMSFMEKRAKMKAKKGESKDLVFKEQDLSTGGLRKGGKKGHHKFKSKSKFRRR